MTQERQKKGREKTAQRQLRLDSVPYRIKRFHPVPYYDLPAKGLNDYRVMYNMPYIGLNALKAESFEGIIC